MSQMRIAELDNMRKGFNFPPMEYPTLVRYVQLNEIASVMVPCMKAKGFVVAANAGGTGIKAGVDRSQNEPFARAQVECSAMYSTDPRYSLPPSTNQKRVIYEYYTQFVIPCVRKQGFTIANLPSEAVWVANPQILDSYPFGNDTVEVACPINTPTSAYLGGD